MPRIEIVHARNSVPYQAISIVLLDVGSKERQIAAEIEDTAAFEARTP